MRLIDADKFILALMDASLSSVDEDTILDLVDSINTVDAVPVVRCKDCKYFDSGYNGVDMWEWCKHNHIDVYKYWFCKSGVRKVGKNG